MLDQQEQVRAYKVLGDLRDDTGFLPDRHRQEDHSVVLPFTNPTSDKEMIELFNVVYSYLKE